MICGGSYTELCYKYVNDTWEEAAGQLSEAKNGMASTLTESGSWWVSGGYGDNGRVDTIEIYTPGEGFSISGITLPVPSSKHSLLTLKLRMLSSCCTVCENTKIG